MSHGNWGVFEIREEIHVIPIEDSTEHLQSSLCCCKPTRKAEPDAKVIYSHSSFDGREMDERRPS